MFYTRVIELCKERNTTISALITYLGMSKSNISSWRSGTIPNGKVLSKLSEYFDVSVDYLLGNTNDPSPPAKTKTKAVEDDVTLDDIEYAFYGETKDLSAEDKEVLLNMARRLKKLKEEREK